jgi:hypothetical protein
MSEAIWSSRRSSISTSSPVIPFKPTANWNVIARMIVPINSFPGTEGTRSSSIGGAGVRLEPGAIHKMSATITVERWNCRGRRDERRGSMEPH